MDVARPIQRHRTALLAFILFVCCALVSVGAWKASESAGLIVGGILLAVWSWLVLSEASGA